MIHITIQGHACNTGGLPQCYHVVVHYKSMHVTLVLGGYHTVDEICMLGCVCMCSLIIVYMCYSL